MLPIGPTAAVPAGFFSRDIVVVFFFGGGGGGGGGGDCFCGERICEEYPKNKRNLLLFGGEIQNLGGEISPPKAAEKNTGYLRDRRP